MEEKIKKSGTKKKNTKLELKDKKKFGICIIVFVVIVLVIMIIALNNKKDIANINDLSNLNANKYSSELKEKYDTDESKEKFLEDYDYVQGAIGIYIMNNSTLEEDSFTKLSKTIETELKKNDWKVFEIEKPTFWNGEFSIDAEGILKFKFASKDIEPKWLNDEELENKIIFND